MVFHHVGVDVSNFEKSEKLYDALTSELRIESYDLPGHIAKAYGTKTCSFRIVQDDSRELSASSSHICLTADSDKAVEEFYNSGTDLGAAGVYPPSAYQEFGWRHYTAMIKDYDGNNIEAVFVDQG
jgi:catechol 2,3-dioxygenase-like lactoylglutathione lyase family enzyme